MTGPLPTDVPPPPAEGRAPWLTLVGIGEDGLDGLSPAARGAIAAAGFVAGGARHLALAAAAIGPGTETMAWPSPFAAGIPPILARRGGAVVVLASGDPFFYGVGATLAAHVPAAEMRCLPAPSAFSLAAARLGWPLQDCRLVSLHGRDFDVILPELQPGARILALAWDGGTAAYLATQLVLLGMGDSRLTVLERMGGPRERIRSADGWTFDLDDVDPLNTIAVEIVAGRGARIIPRAPGLPEALFEHDGQITKREVRAITLAALAPCRGERLWDVGAGSGSVAIEWLLADPATRAIAVEPRADRAQRIARNAAVLGVPRLEIVEGRAPQALAGLAPPDAVFVGGGASEPGVLDVVWAALSPGGRLVVNAVTLETQALLVGRQAAAGGELVQIQIARAEAVGGFLGFRPAMPVVQWRVRKP